MTRIANASKPSAPTAIHCHRSGIAANRRLRFASGGRDGWISGVLIVFFANG
jgi:hypothetical protein